MVQLACDCCSCCLTHQQVFKEISDESTVGSRLSWLEDVAPVGLMQLRLAAVRACVRHDLSLELDLPGFAPSPYKCPRAPADLVRPYYPTAG